MTQAQLVELLNKWRLYSPAQQISLFEEYKVNGGDVSSKNDFHTFLIEKLESEGYWRKIGFGVTQELK